MKKLSTLLLIALCSMVQLSAQTKVVGEETPILTFTTTKASVTINIVSSVAGQTAQVDWGNGTKVDIASVSNDEWTPTPIIGTPTGIVKIYGSTDIYYLDAPAQEITSINLSNAAGLKKIYLNGNALSSLDLSGLTNLTKADIFGNNLTSLDLSKNLLLTDVRYYNNPNLGNVDLSNNTKLLSVYCSNTGLNSIDLSKNVLLQNLYCLDNPQLTSINFVNNPDMKYISIQNCGITAIDLSPLSKQLGTVFLQGNKLSKASDITFATSPGRTHSLNISNNLFKMSTLPVKNSNLSAAYNYQPQPAYALAATATTDDVIDLSSENNLMGVLTLAQTTTYSWATTTGTALTEGTDYTVTEAGKFKFITVQPDGAVCTMATAAFPNFSGANVYKTTAVVINAGTGVKSAELNSKIYGIKGAIMINDLDGASIEIYNLQGAKVHSQVTSENQTLIPMNEGIYFVKVALGTQKVIVK